MSIDIFKDQVCIDAESGAKLNHHSIFVGNKCAYCGNCGKILIEFKKKEDFKRLMNPFGDSD